MNDGHPVINRAMGSLVLHRLNLRDSDVAIIHRITPTTCQHCPKPPRRHRARCYVSLLPLVKQVDCYVNRSPTCLAASLRLGNPLPNSYRFSKTKRGNENNQHFVAKFFAFRTDFFRLFW